MFPKEISRKFIFGGSFITKNQQIAQMVIDVLKEKDNKIVLHKFSGPQYEVITNLDNLIELVGKNNVFSLGLIKL